MLGAWLRLKYPHVVDGVIAASAPVLHFENDPEHPVDPEAFLRIVTFDMTPAAGSSANCVPNVRKAAKTLARLAQTLEGRVLIADALHLCDAETIMTEDDIQALYVSTIGAFGTLAMGNYPYPSSYMTEGAVDLPAYPVRAACEFLAPDFGDDDRALLDALRQSAGVFYNATGKETCFFPSEDGDDAAAASTGSSNATDPLAANRNETVIQIKGNLWSYIECSELYMPMGSDDKNDVFPAAPANRSKDNAACEAVWGVPLRPNWAQTQYGGVKALRFSSNIVFSNGNYDPWSGTGVLKNLSDSVVYLPIEGGAHHVDLFFAHPLDPPALTAAREAEKSYIRQWIREFYARKQQ
ncbi:hypothetical protein ATCC90586_004515 [Pythium insidiosum]|nr:hypothetical protein ATCC90586_004515 [Pythium insidiosum]